MTCQRRRTSCQLLILKPYNVVCCGFPTSTSCCIHVQFTSHTLCGSAFMFKNGVCPRQPASCTAAQPLNGV